MNAKEECAVLYEQGRELYFEKDASAEKRAQGLSLLLKAKDLGDSRASLLVARLYLEGAVLPPRGSGEEQGLLILERLASRGDPEGRAALDGYCNARYERTFAHLKRRADAGVTLFDGSPLTLDRKGKSYPVNAFLERKKGKNILHLQVYLRFSYTEDLKNEQAFKDAVRQGIRAWQGEYRVFGGQRLYVRVSINEEKGRRARLTVLPLAGELHGTLGALTEKMPKGKRKSRVKDILTHRRSFAGAGGFWSVRFPKVIFLQSPGGRFDDLKELTAVTTHEFGHILGLGDLYEGRVDGLAGVKRGSYPELDCYALGDKRYNLVMCDHHGMISNNDMEMVLLALSQNKFQLYQPFMRKKKVSAALGRGN